ncbi:DUF1688-domain-containing protein [Cylindrobasidium torrendii FP15055 ss-10]|uniref:DUF1688-domain-containing protein n=1 Tax=Cylindrobasidium torrendii FP15055 ss-10 TaxID=1314674 RepID=A0A0D7BHJ3_9AGAR|nr:DUF1688-domain-containing protein [Cylindrobasidium torrendii FP15055 ss-10]
MNISATLTPQQTAAYLRTLPAVRERCGRVFELAKEGKLQYFDYHPDKEAEVADFCLGLMKRDFGDNFAAIPPHGRWRHFEAGADRITPLLESWTGLNEKEKCKRLIDLFVVSVLLDAGAGKDWAFDDPATGKKFGRSEGLAIASLHMFVSGFFSSKPDGPHQVDAEGLKKVTVSELSKLMQVSDSNPMVGLEGRTNLLINLSKAMSASPELFGADGRPGNLLDFLESQSTVTGTTRQVPFAALWHVLIDGLNPIWPASRVVLGDVPLGDAWPCSVLKASATAPGDEIVPFHKLTQWLTYSVIEAIVKVLKWDIVGKEDMTGLPEYRNGGLFLDLGVLSLKEGALPVDQVSKLPKAEASDSAIVEWRAMTVVLLDRTADAIRSKLGLTVDQLSLAQVLESATWKGGREIAKAKRPATGGPPIDLVSDGTIF